MSLDGYHAVLVLGGIRSGKSGYAESLVADAPEVRYIATGQPAVPADDPDWAARVAAHRARRPATWSTEETGADPGRLLTLLAEARPGETVLVDDLGGWLAAVLGEAGWPADIDGVPVAALADAVRTCPARLVLVSPEVGLSLVPQTASGRVFADAAGTANRALAEVVDAVALVVAGQPVWVKRPAAPVGRAATAAPGPGAVPAVTDVIEPGMSLPLPDEEAAVAATERLRHLDLPGTGLGGLGRVVSFVAGVQQAAAARPFEAIRVLLLYGAHDGAVAAGDAALDWARRVADVRRGEGPLCLLAERLGAGVQVVDTVAGEGLGTAAAIESRDAMAADAVDAALRYGVALVDAAVDSGADLLVLAAAGPGQDAVAAALVSSTTSREPAALLGLVQAPGGTIDDNAWMARCAAVRDALRRVRNRPKDAKTVLGALGGPDFAVAVGVLLGAAARRTPVVLDGPVGVAAALVGRELATQVRLWALILDESGHPGVRAGADVLSLEPVVKLGLGLGEGANALAALPLVQAALVLSTLDTIEPPSDSAADPAPEADPTDPEPANADLADADLTDAEPTDAEPTDAEPTDAEPASADPADADAATGAAGDAEPAAAEPAG